MELSSKFIPGITVDQVVEPLIAMGFSKEEFNSKEYGSNKILRLKKDGVEYTVDVIGNLIGNVISVKVSGISTFEQDIDIVDYEKFFVFISAIKYKGSNPELATKWVVENFDSKKAITEIGNVSFQVFFATKYHRSLRIAVL